jgi:single-strand DNA-binding protein
MRIGIVGRIQTGKYEDKDGKTVYTTDIVAEEVEFVENKGSGGNTSTSNNQGKINEGFISTDNIDDSELPFN